MKTSDAYCQKKTQVLSKKPWKLVWSDAMLLGRDGW